MAVFHLTVVTPERMFFDGEVERVVVRTVSGDIGILKGHAKYISALGIGMMRIKTADGEKTAALAEGFVKVDGDHTTVLATTCEWADEIDVARAKRAEDRARAALKSASGRTEHDIAELKLKRALNRIRVAK